MAEKLCIIPEIDEAQVAADLIANAIEALPLLRPFFIENWPPALLALSVQTERLSLDDAALATVLRFIDASWSHNETGAAESRWSDPAIYPIVAWCDDAIKRVGGRGFARLGSRSPKDNPEFMSVNLRPIPLYTGRQALQSLGYSERIYLDLSDAQRASYIPTICVRRWIDLEPDQEFRCFIEDGSTVGITQYYLDDGPSSWIRKNAASIERVIRSYLSDVVSPLSGLSSLTCDIILSRDLRPTLLEINPPVSWGKTFPGLFQDGNYDGSFRVLRDALIT